MKRHERIAKKQWKRMERECGKALRKMRQRHKFLPWPKAMLRYPDISMTFVATEPLNPVSIFSLLPPVATLDELVALQPDLEDLLGGSGDK